MNLRDLKLRARALFRPHRVEQELHDELAFHVERETKKLIDDGLAPAEARRRAQARFGSATLAADECRDERGTAFIDNTIRDIQYALRTFRRAPLAACTIVVTVAIGLGVVAVLFTILNTFLFRVDQVPDISEMYAVERPRRANGDSLAPDASAFRSAASGNERLHRRLCGAVRHRPARRRPDDGGHARHRQFLPGRGRQRRDGTRPQSRGRRAVGRQSRDRAERQGLGSPLQSRSERAGTDRARHRRALRDRRRHAGRFPRPRGGRTRLLGAAVAARAVPSRTSAAARTASAWRSSAG